MSPNDHQAMMRRERSKIKNTRGPRSRIREVVDFTHTGDCRSRLLAIRRMHPSTLLISDAIPPPLGRGRILQHPPSRLIYDFVPCKINNTDASKVGEACQLGGTSIEGRISTHDSRVFLDID